MENLPLHVAIIPDGNRRWARRKRLVPWEGHRRGKETFEKISEAAFEAGIPWFSFWAASEDNLTKRDHAEIKFLVFLLREELESSIGERLIKNDTRLRFIGRWDEIICDSHLAAIIDSLEEKTRGFQKKNLTVLFGYNGTTEMAEAAFKIALESINPRYGFEPQELTFERLKRFSWTKDLPPVDLEIRTGEEKEGYTHRSAAFLPFLTANSVTYSTKTLWPDFSEEEFFQALERYSEFERRFGA